MMDLKAIRKQIDKIDNQLIDLLIKRYDLVLDVKAYKDKHQLPILDQTREAQIYQKLEYMKYQHQLKEIYHLMMSLSKDMQKS